MCAFPLSDLLPKALPEAPSQPCRAGNGVGPGRRLQPRSCRRGGGCGCGGGCGVGTLNLLNWVGGPRRSCALKAVAGELEGIER